MNALLLASSFAGILLASPQTQKPAPAASADPMIELHPLSKVSDLDLKCSSGKSCGEIDGLILDASTGRIAYALVGKGGVLGIGETEHLVPWESIMVSVNEKGDGCMARTAASAEQIEKSPVYSKKDPIDAAMDMKARESVGLANSSGAASGTPGRYLSTAELYSAKVLATDEKELGAIDEVVIAPRDGAVAYAVLASGGMLGLGEKHYPLPWQVLETTRDKDQKLVVHAPLTKEKLTSAPVYDAKEWKRMSTPTWVREVSTYYAKEPYWMRTTPASAERKKSE